MFGRNTIQNFKDNNVCTGECLICRQVIHLMCILDHVLVTDEAASGVAPITVDKNGTYLLKCIC